MVVIYYIYLTLYIKQITFSKQNFCSIFKHKFDGPDRKGYDGPHKVSILSNKNVNTIARSCGIIKGVNSSTFISNLECISGSGREYMGKRSITQKGHICQEWISNSPRSHQYHDLATFPDRDTVSTLAEVRNYCRNPDRSPEGPWCHGLTGSRWAYCGIPRCNPGQRRCNLNLLYCLFCT